MLKQTGKLVSVEQVNGDVIYKQRPLLTQNELSVIVSEQIKGYLDALVSFSIESNLATSAGYNVLHSAHTKGFRVELYYVCLEDAEQCRRRVVERVRKGGHDVPFPIIEHRYKNALSLIKQQYALFDQIDFIDNSAGAFTSVLRVENGAVIHQQTDLPNWAAGIAKHVHLLERVRRKTQP